APTRSLQPLGVRAAPRWSPAAQGNAQACRVVAAPLPAPRPVPGPVATLLLDELASTLIKGAESLLSGDGRPDLVVVPWILRLRRLLDLDQIRRVNLAPVRANSSLAEERIVGRHLLHLGDDLGAVVALERLDGLQIVERPRVDAGVDHRRMDLPVALGEALREGARLVVQVPVERLGERQPLRLVETERVDVREKHQEPREALAALDDAKLGALLDGVRGVAAGIGQADDLGLRGLRLKQEGREVLRVERVPDLAEHLAAVLQHD